MRKVLIWCNVEEHPGVKGEACRLLAWIIKNAVAVTDPVSIPSACPPPSEAAENSEASSEPKAEGEAQSSETESGAAAANSGVTMDRGIPSIPVGVAVLHSLVEAGALVPMMAMLQSDYSLMVHE